MKLVTAAEMEEIDRRTSDEYGIPPLVLMENAGIRIWEAFLLDLKQGLYRCESSRPETLRLVFLCGGGNNGGDGMVMARQGWNSRFKRITVVLSSDPDQNQFSSSAAAQLNICRNLGIPLINGIKDPGAARAALEDADLIFDGMTGTGVKGELRPPLKDMAERINGFGTDIAAIDIPSGLGDQYRYGYAAVRASVTYTVGLPKLSLYLPAARTFAGTVRIVPIGFPETLTKDPLLAGDLAGWEDFTKGFPLPGEESYKNIRGHLGVFAGSRGGLGAARLASQAGGRSLPGLVTLYVDPDLYSPAASFSGGVMVKSLDENEPPGTERFTACLAGPGWGRVSRKGLLERLLSSPCGGVLDADGLNLYADMGLPPPSVPWVLTPHPGEMVRLTGKDKKTILEDPLEACRFLSKKTGCVVVLKTHVVFIVAPDENFTVVDGMNAALGTGGSGDILAGIIAGFLASGMAPHEAAWRGAVVHQEAGRRQRLEGGWFLAEDLLPRISRIVGQRGGPPDA